MGALHNTFMGPWGVFTSSLYYAMVELLDLQSLKQKYGHIDEITVTCCTRSCLFCNFHCTHWIMHFQYDGIIVYTFIMNVLQFVIDSAESVFSFILIRDMTDQRLWSPFFYIVVQGTCNKISIICFYITFPSTLLHNWLRWCDSPPEYRIRNKRTIDIICTDI